MKPYDFHDGDDFMDSYPSFEELTAAQYGTILGGFTKCKRRVMNLQAKNRLLKRRIGRVRDQLSHMLEHPFSTSSAYKRGHGKEVRR